MSTAVVLIYVLNVYMNQFHMLLLAPVSHITWTRIQFKLRMKLLPCRSSSAFNHIQTISPQ